MELTPSCETFGAPARDFVTENPCGLHWAGRAGGDGGWELRRLVIGRSVLRGGRYAGCAIFCLRDRIAKVLILGAGLLVVFLPETDFAPPSPRPRRRALYGLISGAIASRKIRTGGSPSVRLFFLETTRNWRTEQNNRQLHYNRRFRNTRRNRVTILNLAE